MSGCAGKPNEAAGDRQQTASPTTTAAAPSPTATSKPTPTPTAMPTPTPTSTPTPTPTPTEALKIVSNGGEFVGVLTVEDWASAVELPPITCDYIITKVMDSMNIRSGPGMEYQIIGKMHKMCYGKILERAEGWTKIQSGDVVGYISNTLIYMDEEAIKVSAENDIFRVSMKFKDINVNVRKGPGTDYPIIGTAAPDSTFVWYPELSTDEWYAIQYKDDMIAYIHNSYTIATSNIDLALTMAQEEARIRAEWFAKAMAYSKAHPPKETNRAPISLTDEELYLMSVVVAMEALYEPYEGKVMVANVIVNRILNGEWGHTLKEVVYAPGQFTGANSGRVELFWNRVNEDCKRATIEAVMGRNNIGDYLFFISIGKARFDLYYDYYVYHGHCFYKRHW
jgi:uncharacterized protein YgiM (DUF1202 family)